MQFVPGYGEETPNGGSVPDVALCPSSKCGTTGQEDGCLELDILNWLRGQSSRNFLPRMPMRAA